MEYFYSDDPQEIENEKKKQECFRYFFPQLMGKTDETTYVLTGDENNENYVTKVKDKPEDKLYNKKQEVYNKVKVLTKEAGFAIRNPRAAKEIGTGVIHNSTNISTKATRFATKGNILYGTNAGEEELGSENGAFRHTLWQAEIASRFGEATARQAGNAHEIDPSVDLNNRRFNHVDNADQTTDLLNNQIGRIIGTNNPKKHTNELALLILEEFRNNGLYVAEKDEDGVWNVKKRKLSEEKYDRLRKKYNIMDKYGFTEEDYIRIEEENKRKLQGEQISWGTMK